MRINHEICIAAPADPIACVALQNALMDAIGHGPGLKFKADSPEDTVHGRVTVQWCEARTLGADVLEFRGGRRELASEGNIGAWFEEQGHRLIKIEGDQAFGNTIVRVQVTEADEEPIPGRRTTLRRPADFPTAESIVEKIEAFAAAQA